LTSVLSNVANASQSEPIPIPSGENVVVETATVQAAGGVESAVVHVGCGEALAVDTDAPDPIFGLNVYKPNGGFLLSTTEGILVDNDGDGPYDEVQYTLPNSVKPDKGYSYVSFIVCEPLA
jgi:hypothetical protein